MNQNQNLLLKQKAQDAKKQEADARAALEVAQKQEDDAKAALDEAVADATDAETGSIKGSCPSVVFPLRRWPNVGCSGIPTVNDSGSKSVSASTTGYHLIL